MNIHDFLSTVSFSKTANYHLYYDIVSGCWIIGIADFFEGHYRAAAIKLDLSDMEESHEHHQP